MANSPQNTGKERVPYAPRDSRIEQTSRDEQIEAGVDSNVDLGVGSKVSEYIKTAEVAEAVEDSEAMGNVSESEQTGRDKIGGRSRGKRTMTPAQKKEYLLKNMPSESVMRRQIKREIEKEIASLRKKAMSMARSPKQSDFYEMSGLMAKIRELKGVLFDIVKASFESIKTLWLRYVHGIM